MNTISNILQSFLTQNILGYIGVTLILIVICLGFIYNMRVKKKYENLLNAFNESEWINVSNNEDQKELKFLNSELKAMADDFRKSAIKGTYNINTEVIIQKNIEKRILKEENIANILPSISIALGLIGTFLGLTVAIMTTTGILSSGTQSMADFSRSMNMPLGSMSSAFWTSIVGVIGSIILNCLNINLKRAKEDFYDVFEDYLDNILFSIYIKSDKDVLTDFMNKALGSFSIKLDELFNKGINNLVEGINKNTLDMTSTFNGMNKHISDLENIVSYFRVSVMGIKTPIKSFGEDLEKFSRVSAEFCNSVNSTNNKFLNKSARLEESVNELSKAINDNKREINKLCMRLEVQSNEVRRGYNTFNDVFNIIKDEQSRNNKIISNQISKLNDGYREFERGINKFSSNVSNMKNEVANGIYYALQRETQELSSNIVDKLNVPLRDISLATEELSRSTNRNREIGKADSGWKKDSKEIGRC
ncbi:hypothetical protein LTX14_002676 [Clostridium perfringens]|uniref:hypothetical protein n=1 Tax=Clostridium perfringens TaxID=1502 RepID=UPI000F536F01|nr:hypothetical protein [Clostridium perfringens]EJT6342100.1 hypothetical protein [Clostridium perfringens]ELQ0173117.1 hypothetical protein [Clostridium perfringens]MDU7726519.1 hypothetical protein [Clostridium perfringens]UBK97907.1 hypothetical protein KLF26_01410 [Clostridium perfringens]CAJ1610060.1 hypothetical protein CLO5623_01490 [Clostridium perfringens]